MQNPFPSCKTLRVWESVVNTIKRYQITKEKTMLNDKPPILIKRIAVKKEKCDSVLGLLYKNDKEKEILCTTEHRCCDFCSETNYPENILKEFDVGVNLKKGKLIIDASFQDETFIQRNFLDAFLWWSGMDEDDTVIHEAFIEQFEMMVNSLESDINKLKQLLSKSQAELKNEKVK
jgi:hypothetical protein